MKFVCIGYYGEENWNAMSPDEQDAFVEQCCKYDDFLRENGHFIGGEALQESGTAKTLRFKSGKLMITDGPYAETKEQIGGLLLLEAQSMDHALQLMSAHPGVRIGPFEIRPADEATNAMVAERAAARSREKSS